MDETNFKIISWLDSLKNLILDIKPINAKEKLQFAIGTSEGIRVITINETNNLILEKDVIQPGQYINSIVPLNDQS